MLSANRLAFYGMAFMVLSCTPDLYDDPIPYFPFAEVTVPINNYPELLSDGGYKYINNAGVRGVILYRKNSTTFIAFERNCSYHPNDPCATVEVHTSTLYIFDACCNSSFNFEGIPTGGPAWRPLRQYLTYYDGAIVTITDEIVE